MNGPLEGIRVVECGIWMQAPYATKLLADLGADVVKVEERLGGDPIRGIKPGHEVPLPREAKQTGRTAEVESQNQNKRSIALDLRKEKGKEILYRLVEKADVFVHNFRLGVTERLGIDYQTLTHYNPGLIYAHTSAFGTKGPISHRPSIETTAMGRAGWFYLCGEPDMPPLMFKPGIGDDLVGVYAALGILAAIVFRQRNNIGQFIDISALGSLIAAQSYIVTYELLYGMEHPRRSKRNAVNPLHCYYKCQDNKWIFLSMMQTDRYWHDFCKVLNLKEFEQDPKFHNQQARAKHSLELISILDKAFNSRPRDEWIKLLEDGGDFVFGPVNTVSDMINDPQVLANEYIREYEHPALGRTKVVGFPYQFSKTPASIRRLAPEHGEHTEEILLEIGYTWHDITELKRLEAIL